MPAMLAVGLGTVCVIAAVLLFVTGHTTAGIVAAVVGIAFDLLFAKALVDARKAKVATDRPGPDASSRGSALRGKR